MGGGCLGYCYRVGFVVLMVMVLLVVGRACGSGAMGDGTIEISYQGCFLSIDVQKARVFAVSKEFARRARYESILPEELLGNRTTFGISGVDLDAGTRFF